MSHDMMSCGQVEKIKRHGLAKMDWVASVKGKSKDLERQTARGREA